MALLRSNKVYKYRLAPVKAFYETWLTLNVFCKYGSVPLSSTFKEDLDMCILYVNSDINDFILEGYAEKTRWEFDEDLVLRLDLLYALSEELNKYAIVTRGSVNYRQNYGVHIGYDEKESAIYVVDTRPAAYVPDDIYTQIRQRINKSILVDSREAYRFDNDECILL